MARGTAQVGAGMTLAAAGLFVTIAGLLGTSLLPDLGPIAGWQLATVLGFVLLLAGALLAVFSIPREEAPVPLVSATEAFASKRRTPLAPPVPAPIATPRRLAAPQPTAPSPPARAMDAQTLAMFRLDEEIRDLTRRINKAGVMLATGQLSTQGYALYVEDLKKEKGQLEASRVTIELRRRA